jgi:hypothetical protein
MLDHLFAQDDHAVTIDANAAMNTWVPLVRLNPSAVDPSGIANDARLTAVEKDHLLVALRQEQSGRAQGDGPAFAQVYEAINAAPGSPGRVNTAQDLSPFMGNGLTFSGIEKLQKVVNDRDKPEMEVQKAAMAGWRSQIEGMKGGIVSRGPVSQAKWASFLGAALPMIDGLRREGKMTMAQIVADNGPIAKLVPSYLLRPDEIAANLGLGDAAPGTDTAQPDARRGTPGLPLAPTDRAPAAVRPVQGHWYIPQNGVLTEVPVGTPKARPYNGGEITDPASWEAPHPSAPAN